MQSMRRLHAGKDALVEIRHGERLDGVEGTTLSPHAGEFIEIGIRPPPGPVIDTTGAGDCFYAGLLTGLLRGLSVEQAGRLGAAQRALDRAGISWGDLAAVELNEAFAAQAMACLVQWPDLDPSIVNPNGGAIALGHPIGCSGARIVTTLAHELRRRGGGWGLATMCIGVGQGIAVVVKS